MWSASNEVIGMMIMMMMTRTNALVFANMQSVSNVVSNFPELPSLCTQHAGGLYTAAGIWNYRGP